MRTDPFAILGLTPRSTPAQARAAYRRLALLHHPDHNPGDRGAADRFKRILGAYRRIGEGGKLKEPTVPRTGPRPDRYACGTCGDSFPFAEVCARCGVALHDRDAGPPPPDDRPEVQAMIDRLLAQPEPEPNDDHPGKVPALLIIGCALAAMFVWQVGPIGPALLLAGFGTWIAFVEVHRRATTPIMA